MKKNIDELKIEYNEIPVPAEALSRIQLGIDAAKAEKKENVIPLLPPRKALITAAAALALCFVTVNSSSSVANAMGNLPLVGKFFSVITIRDFAKEDGNTSVTAQIPQINEDSNAATNVNEESRAYIDTLLSRFEKENADYPGGYASLDISYNVVADTERFFSLDITATETAASGYEFHKFYTIDKQKDAVVTLSDLCESGYVDKISAEILRQMKADSENEYFIGADGFNKIADDESFYVDKDGQIVIAFDEAVVGPASIGTPRFTIPSSVVAIQ